jgi:hypothetical protein
MPKSSGNTTRAFCNKATRFIPAGFSFLGDGTSHYSMLPQISLGAPKVPAAKDDLRFYFRPIVKGQRHPIDPSLAGGLYVNYDLRDLLGKGAFASVRRAMDRRTGEWRAVKIINT